MKQGFLLVFLISLALAQTCNSPSSIDRRANRSRLRLATFNLAWLFDGVNDPSGSPWLGAADAARHVEKVAEQIAALDVDVMAVHEVENCNVLASLVGFLGSSYRFFLVPGTDSATGQNSALITRLDPTGPLTRTEDRVSTPVPGSGCSASPSSTGVSKHAIASFRASSFTFDLVLAHFKSGGLTSDCAQREGQASVLRNALRSVPTVVMGDLNDWDDSFTDATGRTGTSRTLSILKSSTLTNVNSQLPVANRSSSGSGLIDHILLSSELSARVMSVSIDNTGLPTTSSGKLAAFYSDHIPLVVTLRDASAASLGVSALLFILFAIIV